MKCEKNIGSSIITGKDSKIDSKRDSKRDAVSLKGSFRGACRKKLVSYALIFVLFAGIQGPFGGFLLKDTKIGTTASYGAEITAGGINPIDKNFNIEFRFDVTQRVNIGVKVNGEDEELLAEDYEVQGSKGSLSPMSYKTSSFFESRAVNEKKRDNVDIESVEVENENGEKEKRIRVSWDGRIDGIPLIGKELDEDYFTLEFSVYPQGYPERSTYPRTETGPGGQKIEIDGENWTWTQDPAFIIRTSMLVDYRVLTEGGDPAFLMIKGGSSDYMLGELMEQFLAGASILDIAANFSCKDKIENNGVILQTNIMMDPVNMVDGNYIFSYKDFEISGLVPLKFVRCYSSRNYKNGALGKGFTHSYEYSLTDDVGIIRITVPGGEEIRFLREKAGTYRALQNSGFTLKEEAGFYALCSENGSRHIFDADGKLKEIISEAGQKVAELLYDGGGKLVKITGLNGEFNFTYENGYIKQITDGAGRTSTYEYEADHLVKVTNPVGDSLRYVYDENGYISEVYDFEENLSVKNIYDEKGRVLHQEQISGDGKNVADFSYDDGARTNKLIQKNGRTLVFEYDSHRNLIRVTDDGKESSTKFEKDYPVSKTLKSKDEIGHVLDEQKRVVTLINPDMSKVHYEYAYGKKVSKIIYEDSYEEYRYDAKGNVTAYRDRNGNVTEYSYDADGFLTEEKDPMGGIKKYTYENNNISSFEDEEGGLVSFKYDEFGRVTEKRVKINDNEESVLKFEYDASGKLTKVIDPLGGEIKYEHDRNGFLVKKTDQNDGVTEARYGGNGEAVYEKNPLGGEYTYEYDEEDGKLIKETDPLGGETGYVYEKDGKLKSVYDSKQNKTSYEYNENDEVVKVTDPLMNEEKYEYDKAGNIISYTDKNGNETQYKYDIHKRRTEIIDPYGKSRTYRYDKNGNLLEAKDKNGIGVRFTYDKNDRITEIYNGENKKTEISYDKAGRVIKRTDPMRGSVYFEYDKAGNVTKYTDENGNETVFVYDKKGNVIKEIYPDGATKSYFYDKASNLVKIEDEEGDVKEITYDKAGNILSIKNALGDVKTFEYDKKGRKIKAVDENGAEELYTYDSEDNLTSYQNKNGAVTRFLYDPLGRIKGLTDPLGYKEEYTYDPEGNLLEEIRNGILREKNTYDKLGRIKTSQNANLDVEEYFYDNEDNVISHSDREGNISRFLYTKLYDIEKIIKADGTHISYEYDELGRVISETDEEGAKTGYFYDAASNLIRAVDSLGGESLIKYDVMNRMIEETDELGRITGYSYDKKGNIKEIVDAKSGKEKYTYSKTDKVISYENKNGEKTYFAYDKMGRVKKITNRLNHNRAFSYDNEGNLTAYEDGNKNKTYFEYDENSNLKKRRGEEGSYISYEYDYMGNIKARIMPAPGGGERRILYTYDNESNIVGVDKGTGKQRLFSYDKEGNLISSTDERGVRLEYGYDKVYNLTSVTGNSKSIAYLYDKTGRLTKAEDEKANTLELSYDSLSRIIKSRENGLEMSYEYDAVGNQVKQIYPGGKEVLREYDELDLLKTLTDLNNKKTKYEYDKEGNVIKVWHPNMSSTEIDYNSLGLPVQRKEVTKDGITLRETILAYDDNDNIRLKERTGTGNLKKDRSHRYYYDRENRLLKSIKDSEIRNYRYDRAGNIISDGKNKFSYDKLSRLIKREDDRKNTKNYEYDEAGNLIRTELLKAGDGDNNATGETTAFEYDEYLRLIKAEKSTGEISVYEYNPVGVRIKNEKLRKNKNIGYQNSNMLCGSRGQNYLDYLKDDRATQQRVFTSEIGTVHQNDYETVRTHYMADYTSGNEDDVLEIEDGSFIRENIYDDNGRRLSSAFSYAKDTKEGERGENPASGVAAESIKKAYYRHDVLGSTLFSVDEDGDILSHMEYDEWGLPEYDTYQDMNFTGLSDRVADFTGYTYDDVLGMYFARNRMYDPADHRFIQEDDIEDGYSLYVYCGNDPVNMIDPSGNISKKKIKAFFKGAGKTVVKTAVDLVDVSYKISPKQFIKATKNARKQIKAVERGKKGESAAKKSINKEFLKSYRPYRVLKEAKAPVDTFNRLSKQHKSKSKAAKIMGKAIVDTATEDYRDLYHHYQDFRCGKKISEAQTEKLGASVAAVALDIAPVPAGKVGKVAKIGSSVSKVSKGSIVASKTKAAVKHAVKTPKINFKKEMEIVRHKGKTGELDAGIDPDKKKKHIESLTKKAQRRYPDELDHDLKTLKEVKNVKKQSYTRQIKDFNLWAQNKGYEFTLILRDKNTMVTKPLREEIEKGNIKIDYIYKE